MISYSGSKLAKPPVVYYIKTLEIPVVVKEPTNFSILFFNWRSFLLTFGEN